MKHFKKKLLLFLALVVGIICLTVIFGGSHGGGHGHGGGGHSHGGGYSHSGGYNRGRGYGDGGYYGGDGAGFVEGALVGTAIGAAASNRD